MNPIRAVSLSKNLLWAVGVTALGLAVGLVSSRLGPGYWAGLAVAMMLTVISVLKSSRPEFTLLLLFVVSIPLESLMIPLPVLSVSLPNILILMIGVVLVVGRVMSKKRLAMDGGGVLLLLLVLYSLVITLSALQTAQHLRSVVSLVGGVLVYLVLTWGIETKKDLITMVRVLWITVAVAGGIGVLQGLLATYGLSFGRVDQFFGFSVPVWRVSGTYLDPNAYSYFLLSGLPGMMLAYLSPSRLLARGTLTVLILLAAGGWVLAFSRGGWVGLSFAGCLLLFMAMRDASRSTKPVVFSLIMLVVPLLALNGWIQLLVTGLIDLNPGSSQTHMDLWTIGIRVVSEHPMGVGFQGWSVLPYQQLLMEDQREMHNTYLQVATALGVVGSTAYLAFLARVFFMGMKPKSGSIDALSRALTASFLGLAVAAFFVDVLFTKPLWTVAGLISAAARIGLADEPEEPLLTDSVHQ